MRKEIIEFWRQNKTPIGLMRQKARNHNVKPQQVEIAAQIVFEEVKEIIENVPEISWHMNGSQLERIILLQNHLRPNVLGWRVFTVAKFVEIDEKTGEIPEPKKGLINWIKSWKWELDPWQ